MSCIKEIKDVYAMFFEDIIKIHKIEERIEQEYAISYRISSILRVTDLLAPVVFGAATIALLLEAVVPIVFGLLNGSANGWELLRQGVLPVVIFVFLFVVWGLIDRMRSRCVFVAHDQADDLHNHIKSISKKGFEECLCKLKLAKATDEFMEGRIRVVSASQGRLLIDENLSYKSNIAITLDLSSTYSLKECAKKGDMELVFKSRHSDAFKTVFSGSEIMIHQIIIEGQMHIFICVDHSSKHQACVFLKQEKDGSFVDIVSCY